MREFPDDEQNVPGHLDWLTPARRDGILLAAILALAAALRFVGLPGRGQWDDDQGDELLTMLLWVRGGDVPLLGPPSSVEFAHHGAAFYWLLAPGAFLTDASPVAAVTTVALLGITGVAATWSLGRTVGGPVAGHIAGLLMALSPSAISASTFVWNANIVGPAAAIASAGAWHAWRTHNPRWWLLTAVGCVVLVHGHPLSVIFTISLLALLVADVLRRERQDRPQLMGPLVGAAAIVALGLVPLLINEFGSGFAETRAIVAFLSGTAAAGGLPHPDGPAVAVVPRILWRVLVWPISGADASAPLLGVPAAVVTGAALVIATCGHGGVGRQFGRWAAATTVLAVVALAIVVPGLGVTVIGLPTDQYHAWLDPMLIVAIGVAVSRLWASAPALPGKAAALAIVVGCGVLSLVSLPPLPSPDGGWPKAVATAEAIRSITGDRPTAVTGVFKTGKAIEFPLRRGYQPIAGPSAADFFVVVCDPLFEPAVGARCGGEAEDSWTRRLGFPADRLVHRFVDSPRRVVSVFAKVESMSIPAN